MVDKRVLPPTTLVIFGITGDLSRRYLLPAIGQIKRAGILHDDFRVIGTTRRDVNMSGLLSPKCRNLTGQLELIKMDPTSSRDYRSLRETLSRHQARSKNRPHVIFHLSLPPTVVPKAIELLSQNGLSQPPNKLLLEKPFGSDLSSAKSLNEVISHCFAEKQVFRIDHYLAKEMVQNMSVFIDGNSLFRNVWNRQFIDNIDVMASESIGIEGRSGFYEGTGALRDVVQSHGLQLTALALMEPSRDFFGLEDLPTLRLAALRELKVDIAESVHAQYRGYRHEVGDPKSMTETFVSLKLHSTDNRWRGVPIRLTTGKKLDQKLTAIRVSFKKTQETEVNSLMLRIQPREGVEIDLWVKEPGYEHRLKKLPLSFNYHTHYGRLPDAYEKVLVDAMRSDHSLFASSEEVLTSWTILDPVLKLWQKSRQIHIYKPGSTPDSVLKSAKI